MLLQDVEVVVVVVVVVMVVIMVEVQVEDVVIAEVEVDFGSGDFEASDPGQSLQHSPLQPDGGTRSALSELKTQIQPFNV